MVDIGGFRVLFKINEGRDKYQEKDLFDTLLNVLSEDYLVFPCNKCLNDPQLLKGHEDDEDYAVEKIRCSMLKNCREWGWLATLAESLIKEGKGSTRSSHTNALPLVRFAAAFPLLSFEVQCDMRGGHRKSKHWYKAGKQTHEQVGTTQSQWEEKNCV